MKLLNENDESFDVFPVQHANKFTVLHLIFGSFGPTLDHGITCVNETINAVIAQILYVLLDLCIVHTIVHVVYLYLHYVHVLLHFFLEEYFCVLYAIH